MRYKNDTILPAVEEKYDHFCQEIIIKKNYIDGIKIGRKKYPLIDDKCGTFFHMITKEKENVPCKKYACNDNQYQYAYHFSYNPLLNDPKEPRQICPLRLEALNLTDFFNRPLKIWEKKVHTESGQRTRILCLDDKNRYMVVLDKNINKNYIILWTGFPIIYDWQMNKFLEEYEEYFYKTKKKHQTSIQAN